MASFTDRQKDMIEARLVGALSASGGETPLVVRAWSPDLFIVVGSSMVRVEPVSRKVFVAEEEIPGDWKGTGVETQISTAVLERLAGRSPVASATLQPIEVHPITGRPRPPKPPASIPPVGPLFK